MKHSKIQRKQIISFIKQLNERNFSQANQSLERVLHEKIKQRISRVAKKPLF